MFSEMFDLKLGDIIVCRVGKNWGILRPFVSWLTGGFDHVMIYVGNQLLAEARPKKGVSLVSVREHFGREILVLRPQDEAVAEAAAREAIALASDPDTLYDFPAIIRFAIPKLILRKFRIRYKAWHNDRFHICSELVWSAYNRAGFEFRFGGIPLPADFVDHPRLRIVARGTLGG